MSLLITSVTPLLHGRTGTVEPRQDFRTTEPKVATNAAGGQWVARTGTAFLMDPAGGNAQQGCNFFRG